MRYVKAPCNMRFGNTRIVKGEMGRFIGQDGQRVTGEWGGHVVTFTLRAGERPALVGQGG